MSTSVNDAKLMIYMFSAKLLSEILVCEIKIDAPFYLKLLSGAFSNALKKSNRCRDVFRWDFVPLWRYG